MHRAPRALVLLLPLLLLAAACGQKSGVALRTDSGGGAAATTGGGDLGGTTGGDLGEGTSGDVAGGTTGDASTTGGTTGGAGGTTGATAGGGTTGAGTTGGGTTGGGATAGGTTGGGRAPAGPGDRTGITDKEIVIGVHAPVTGAAPFPQDTFDRGKDVYWKFLATKGGVFGRNVRVVFRDDQFNPQRAVQVCRELVEREKVFLLVGGGGADQITACAKYANTVGVPYLSAGVNEEGLKNLRSYFALSMSYPQQSPLLAQLVKNRIKKTKVGVVVADTPSFRDAKSSFIAAAKANGLQVVYDRPFPKNASQGDALSTANALRSAGAEVVYFLSSPTSFISLAQQANGQGYRPNYVGPGVSSGLNQVAEFGCPGVSGAQYLSPFPQLDRVDQMDPEYRPAYRQHAREEPDDIGIALWALNKALNQVFTKAGKDMSRQSFVATLESGQQFSSNLFPPVSYSPTNHFGAKSAHLLQADCSIQQYRTVATFASSF